MYPTENLFPANNIKFNYDQYVTLEEKAKWFSYYHHGVTMHTYDEKSYHEAHLQKVVDVAKRYIDPWVPNDKKDIVLAACWLHDVIEDCRVTYNDVLKRFGYDVAEIVFALTNEKGRNRKERANYKYYDGIRTTSFATFVKLCDRIANIESGLENGGRMLHAYRGEQFSFEAQLKQHMYVNMWSHIEDLLTIKSK